MNGFGPHDYRVVQGGPRKVVEDNHFTPNIEMLFGGNTALVGGEIAYTLRAFPNHHRALVAMMNLGAKLNTDLPPGAGFTVECFFIRALTFRPDDVVARMLYAKFLANHSRKADALKQLEDTAHFADKNGFTHYNMGMLYQDLGEHDRALEQAHLALAYGFERPELQQRLRSVGKWRDPAAPAEPAASPAASAPGG